MTPQEPILSQAEPVFFVKDVAATIRYWQDVLGFPGKWTWGDPPTVGAVNWHGVHIQFALHDTLAHIPEGYSVWIRVRHIEALYAIHQQRKANIVVPLRQEPWGMAQYTVQDLNGCYASFAGPLTDKTVQSEALSPNIRVRIERPTPADYIRLSASVGWTDLTREQADVRISEAVTGVVAENTTTGEIIGCALLLGDNTSYYYVKDVMVHPAWQRKRAGTALMRALTDWLNANGADKALVSLITGETLEPFYQQFGFTQAFSMIRYVQRPPAQES
ncbi:GNAT family N-acetyltransferase [Chitinophaga sp. S165]|uniref:GNAT family N-acetyltransferase n=1 Tax=Chitinophaga sp. S165 TaxID=2135462 RepID=UPI000D71249E|nr:GNAT family N-acetyltransferase [Chitinophaga sp. S165]